MRFYPPFRSAPPSSHPRPRVDLQAIPTIGGRPAFPGAGREAPQLASIPGLGTPASALNIFGGGPLGPEPEWPDPPPRHFPMDSCRIDVLISDADKAAALAASVHETLKALIRRASRQWWINHANYVADMRLQFGITSMGEPVGGPTAYSSVRTPWGDEQPVTSDVWAGVCREIAEGIDIPLYDHLLSEARAWASQEQLARAVIEAAVAVEQARDLTLDRLWRRDGKPGKFRVGKVLEGEQGLAKQLDAKFDKHSSRSYAREHPVEHQQLRHLWAARGGAAHTGDITYGLDNRLHTLTDQTTHQLVLSGEHAVRWMESL